MGANRTEIFNVTRLVAPITYVISSTDDILNIDNTSGAYQKGSNDYLVPIDILGNTRTSNPPDIGAYQSAPFPK